MFDVAGFLPAFLDCFVATGVSECSSCGSLVIDSSAAVVVLSGNLHFLRIFPVGGVSSSRLLRFLLRFLEVIVGGGSLTIISSLFSGSPARALFFEMCLFSVFC